MPFLLKGQHNVSWVLLKFLTQDMLYAFTKLTTGWTTMSIWINLQIIWWMSVAYLQMSVGELALWLVSTDEQKTISVLCRAFRLPQPFRRIVRFTGVFWLLTVLIRTAHQIVKYSLPLFTNFFICMFAFPQMQTCAAWQHLLRFHSTPCSSV